ncbi:MAG: hypothetical protein V1799_02825 [bacterium]
MKKAFDEEVKQRAVERDQSVSLTQSQRYIIRELRMLFKIAEDEDEKAQINILEKAFRSSQTSAVNRELNLLRRNGVTGKSLLKSLSRLYHQHNIQERIDSADELENRSKDIPRIVCSEALG